MAGAEEFDVVVLGGGAAGESVAGRCARGGLNVALVEEDRVGGECSFWACMPSKALLRPGEALAAARRVPGAREAVRGIIQAKAALDKRDQATHHWDDASQVRWLEGQNVRLLRGRGQVSGERMVRVRARDGVLRTLIAKRAVVLATGSSPRVPAIDGLSESRWWSSREATSSQTIPARLLVLGGGVVGVEMAQAWKRLGARQVWVVEQSERLLAHEEPFASQLVAEALTEEGIEVLTGQRVTRVRRHGTAPARIRLGEGRELEADELLVATGRAPNTRGLGLESLGLEPGAPVEVDSQLRAKAVTAGWLYAVGDVNGLALFTHMGKYQARIAADHILGKSVAAEHNAIPRVVFTDPQLAAVGWTEEQARQKGLSIRTVSFAMEELAGTYLRADRAPARCQLVVDQDRRVLVGATLVGSEVGEMLHSATIAIVGQLPLERLWHAVPAFPTVSEWWLRVLEECGL